MPTATAAARSRPHSGTELDRFIASLRVDPSGSTTYPLLLGLPPTEQPQLHALIQQGVPYRMLERFRRAAGFSLEQLARIIQIPMRTLTRRRGTGRLQPDESDRLVRVAWVVGRALALFDGDLAGARRWLETPQRWLGDVEPLNLAATDPGARAVSDTILRIEHGVLA